MPATTSTAPGKFILFGEHSVVYGHPAIAVPVLEVNARAVISALVGKPSSTIQIKDPAFNLDGFLKDLPFNHAVNQSIELTLKELNIETHPAFKLQLSSSIPLASGMGSGAAISVAIIRAVSTFLGKKLDNEIVNKIAFEVEKIHHGTPSGIDNTVVTYQQPVFYVKGQPIEKLEVENAFNFLIADTGEKSSTAVTVADVRKSWEANQEKYNSLFKSCGEIATQAKEVLKTSDIERLGELMNNNHQLLQEMEVSSPKLDEFTQVANSSGAFGAKMSGGGRGGIMIALVSEENKQIVSDTLKEAGAVNIISTSLGVRNE